MERPDSHEASPRERACVPLAPAPPQSSLSASSGDLAAGPPAVRQKLQAGCARRLVWRGESSISPRSSVPFKISNLQSLEEDM